MNNARNHRALVPAAGETKKEFTYKAYKAADVRTALEKLFHGKCAYCETSYAASAPVDIEHYRPKGAVAEDTAHGGYWWVAMQWENLLPSCIECNRKRGQAIVTASNSLAVLAGATIPQVRQTGKKDSFPLADEGVRTTAESTDFSLELPLLLNPCEDDPGLYLAHALDPDHPTGLMVAVGDAQQQARAIASIHIYGLNRLQLFQDRNRVLRKLQFLGDLITDLAESIIALEAPATRQRLDGTAAVGVSGRLRLLQDRLLSEINAATAPEAPYASMASAWLEQFIHKLRS
ncbi:HNH endonuclease [Pseudomonas sp. GD03696]|uniref:HNH endonuclease n=1 Tax=Pseudomonas sp. GD03696 TaxID=2975368 RepID=UPI00244ABDD8|nr:HNH endonuclease [Pseudomonas sp. GD03696]MDH1932681.1 HNH endonuclease [Pseudomonas sp. GD03696]